MGEMNLFVKRRGRMWKGKIKCIDGKRKRENKVNKCSVSSIFLDLSFFSNSQQSLKKRIGVN